ncbi:MAG: tetratricopeptide repeat protein [Treponema sp.]|jgi:tetratricopeptide (TPR) repeat protein|nr:tetratricopeptide repeat protein [Treponema sp.]
MDAEISIKRNAKVDAREREEESHRTGISNSGPQELLRKAYASLKNQDAVSAEVVLEEAQQIYFEDPEVNFALKCVKWWLERIKKLDGFQEAYDKGGFILSQWNSFFSFLERIGSAAFEPCLYAVRRFVFSSALDYFKDVLGEGENQHEPVLLLQVGQCYKGIGNYDLALRYLQQAVRFLREDGKTLSELADVNALLDETRAAKALFREAFFMDPQGVDLSNMESAMIIRLRDRVASLGISGPELPEWIPIYGSIFGTLSVKRALRPVDLGRLRQSIFSLESEIRSGPDNARILRPRLINRYLWLIDHYENAQEDPALIEETMLKIKIIDPGIFERMR